MGNEYWNVLVPELTTLDFKKSIKFYIDILGFSIKYQRENPNFAYLVFEDKVQIMLEEYQETGWNTGQLEYPFGRGINFQIEVSSIDKIEKSLQENNYSLYEEKTEKKYVVGTSKAIQIELLIQDPDGYLLRFVEVVEK